MVFSRTLKNLKVAFPKEIQWIPICKTTTTKSQCEGFPWNHRQELSLIIYVPLGKSRDEVGGWGWGMEMTSVRLVDFRQQKFWCTV